GRLRLSEAAIHKQLGHDGGDPQGGGQPFQGRGVVGEKVPGFGSTAQSRSLAWLEYIARPPYYNRALPLLREQLARGWENLSFQHPSAGPVFFSGALSSDRRAIYPEGHRLSSSRPFGVVLMSLAVASPSLAKRFEAAFPTSRQLFEHAREVFPGGVTHDLRSLEPFPVYIDRAQGAHK